MLATGALDSGRAPREQHARHEAERVDIARRTHARRVKIRLLRTHELWRAHDRAHARGVLSRRVADRCVRRAINRAVRIGIKRAIIKHLGDTKVDDLHFERVDASAHENVARLEIAMHDTDCVRCFDCGCDFFEHA